MVILPSVTETDNEAGFILAVPINLRSSNISTTVSISPEFLVGKGSFFKRFAKLISSTICLSERTKLTYSKYCLRASNLFLNQV